MSERCHGEGEIEVGTVQDSFGTWDTETFKCSGCPDCSVHALVSAVVAACTDRDPAPFDETDGLDCEVASLIVGYLQASDGRLAALLGLDDEADDGDIAAEIGRLRDVESELESVISGEPLAPEPVLDRAGALGSEPGAEGAHKPDQAFEGRGATDG